MGCPQGVVCGRLTGCAAESNSGGGITESPIPTQRPGPRRATTAPPTGASARALGHHDFEIVCGHDQSLITGYIKAVQRAIELEQEFLAALVVQHFAHANDRAKIAAEHFYPVRTAAEAKQRAAPYHAG